MVQMCKNDKQCLIKSSCWLMHEEHDNLKNNWKWWRKWKYNPETSLNSWDPKQKSINLRNYHKKK